VLRHAPTVGGPFLAAPAKWQGVLAVMRQNEEFDMAAPAGRVPAGADDPFRLLVQHVLDYAIFMLDADGRVTVWNEGAARLKGYTEEEIIGQNFAIFFTPEDRQLGKPEYERGMAVAHGRYEGEGWRVRKDGTRFWGNEILTAIRDADGRLTGFTKVARDLTQRKAMEDALRESEERHRLLVENVRDYAVFTLDPDGRVTSWNTGAQRLFGHSSDEIIGRHGSVLFTPEDVATGEHAKELATALTEGRASDDRWQMRKDGSRFWASGVTSAMRDEAGALRGFAKVCRDLTEYKQVEEQRERLLEQEKLARLQAEQAMTMRDEFLAIVSHELRTPLTAILLWAKLMRTGAVSEQERAKVIETIEQSADAQRQLVEDLLDVSRITSGKMRLNVRDADLAVVVRAAAEAVRPMAEAKGIRMELALDERAGQVRADPDRIQQVVWNLLSNAVKFTDRGGRVTVRLGRLDDTVRIEVADTGRGIARGFLAHVFELFRQADATMTRTSGGLGLGLSICKTLVELHGGTITVASPGEGKGATFTVDLPVAGAATEEGPLAHSPAGVAGIVSSAGEPRGTFTPAPVLTGVRVLVVEDENHARQAIRWLLEQCGADVTAAASAPEATRAFALGNNGNSGHGRAYDVLVSDIAMPGQDGYEFIEQIRAIERERAIPRPVPAIALTAHARDADRTRAATAGFDAHVAKPVEPGALVAEVVRLTGRAN
jgi:PAS domain S-box-containing protein